jgi:hypothetical protein
LPEKSRRALVEGAPFATILDVIGVSLRKAGEEQTSVAPLSMMNRPLAVEPTRTPTSGTPSSSVTGNAIAPGICLGSNSSRSIASTRPAS